MPQFISIEDTPPKYWDFFLQYNTEGVDNAPHLQSFCHDDANLPLYSETSRQKYEFSYADIITGPE